MSSKTLAFVITRLSLGINFLGHGIVRLPKLEAFASGISKKFDNTLIDFPPLITSYAYALVFIELALGIALVIGFKTKYTLTIAGLVMMTLIFGTTMAEDWPTLGSQMIYVIVIFILLYTYRKNKVSLDYYLENR